MTEGSGDAFMAGFNINVDCGILLGTIGPIIMA